MARDDIVSFQNRQLRRLIAHAYENVPYYRRLFDRNGIEPQDIKSVADLSLIPITSKNDIQLLPLDDVVARGINPKSLTLRRTSGSSGEPFSIRRSGVEEKILAVIRSRATRDFGLRGTDRLARVNLVRPGEARDNQLSSLIRRKLGLLRRTRVNCLLPLEEILQKLRDFRPDVLAGYPGVLSRLAQILSDEDRRLIHPRFIRVGGEVMTPLMRSQIAEGFKAPVFETYGCWEFSLLAWECKETGEYHTCDDGMILEVIKDGRPAEPGERGEVVGTALHSFAMPLIRFKLGDIVTKGSETCRCGQPFSTIRAIQGRMIDYFTLPDGRMVHPYEIVAILRNDAAFWTRQYQVIQERVDRITMNIVPSFTPQPERVALLEKSVSDLLGQGVESRVVFVPEIQLEATGKFRVFRSLVQSDYDGIDWEN
jgi:phenylacetate-CoA ligase